MRTWWSFSFAPVTQPRASATSGSATTSDAPVEVGPDVALGQLGMRVEVVVGEHACCRGATACASAYGIHLTIARHEREPDLTVEVEHDALEQLVRRRAEVLGDRR